jgi:arginase
LVLEGGKLEKVTFVGIPFYSLAEYQGMGGAVQSLRDAGIVQRLRSGKVQVRDIGDVECPRIDRDHGPGNLRNYEEFIEGTRRVRDKLLKEADGSALTFCLGGECTFTVGSVAGLKKVYPGKPGIVWMDAHGDFNTPETTPSGFIGGMPLAIACGRGPRLPEDLENARPLLEEKRVVHVGSRALDPGEDEAIQSNVSVFDAEEVRKKGAREIARRTAKVLDESSDWIIAHLDVDVLDPSIMPGVNFPESNGLTESDVLQIFRELRSTGKLRAIDLTAYNPINDRDGRGRSLLLDLAPKLASP